MGITGRCSDYDIGKCDWKHNELLSAVNRPCSAALNRTKSCDLKTCPYKYHDISQVPCLQDGCNGKCKRNHANYREIAQYRKIKKYIKDYRAFKSMQ